MNKEGKWRSKQVATSLALETGEGIQARGCEVVDTGEPFRFRNWKGRGSACPE